MAELPLAAVTGAAVGTYAGPIGMIAGAFIGIGVGALVAYGLDQLAHEETAEEVLYDRELGILYGTLGAPGLSHPPPGVGAYSAASAGSAATGPFDHAPTEGPFGDPADA